MLCEWCVNLSETVSNSLQLLIMRSPTLKCTRTKHSVQLLCFHVVDKHTKYPLIRAVGWQQHGAKGNYRGDTLIIASWSPNHLSRLAASSGGPDTPLLQGNPTRSQPKIKSFPSTVVLPQALLPDGCVSPLRPPDQIHQPPQLTPLEAEEQQWHLRKRHSFQLLVPLTVFFWSPAKAHDHGWGSLVLQTLQKSVHLSTVPSLVSQILGYLNSTLSSCSSDPLWDEALRMRTTLKVSLQQYEQLRNIYG